LRHVEDRWVLTALGQSKYLLRDGALTRELGEGFFVRDGQRLKEVEPGVQRTTLEAFAASLEGHVGPLEGRSDSVEGQPATIGDQPMAVEAEPGSRGGGPRSREVSP
jgi:hypothetical protein